jgi:hypothetical protein
MQDHGKYTEFESYQEFRKWNEQCIKDLSEDDRTWIEGLCKRMVKETIFLMDEECCEAMPATNLYFDKDKNVCIVNPR